MRNVLVAVFWLWVVVALGIYAYRVWRRITRGPAPKDLSPTVEADDSARPAPIVPATLATPPVGPLPDRVAKAPPTERAPNPTPERAAAPDPGDPSEARPSVADALAGIVMPCDLMPVVSTGWMDPHRVTFVTESHAATDVSAQVGDELERLGFALQSTSPHELSATKDGTRVTAVIHADARTVTAAGAPAIPNAKQGSVAVEFRT